MALALAVLQRKESHHLWATTNACLLCTEASSAAVRPKLCPQPGGRQAVWHPWCVPCRPCAVQVFSGTLRLPSGSSTERRGLAYHVCLPSSPACRWLSIPELARPALTSCLLMMLIPCWTGRVRMPRQMPINGFHGESLPIL